MRHAIHPDADAEFADAVRYYSAIDPRLGLRFYTEIERPIRTVCVEPKRFFQFSPPTRRALSRQFPYAVLYLEQPDRIWIVAVMHGRRKPGYWRERIQ